MSFGVIVSGQFRISYTDFIGAAPSSIDMGPQLSVALMTMLKKSGDEN